MPSATSTPSGTPRRSNRSNRNDLQSSPIQPDYGPDDQLRSEASQASQSSLQPVPEAMMSTNDTPRASRSSQITSQHPPSSSPLFFQSSPTTRSNGHRNDNPDISSPIRRIPDADDDINDGGRTPRASAQQTMGDSSPIRYMSSSSVGPRTNGARTDALRSESSGLFVRSPLSRGANATSRRHDIHSDVLDGTGRRRNRLVDGNGMPASQHGQSDTATFSNLNPTTSEAAALAGNNVAKYVWGTDVNINDSMATIKDFFYNFRKKYRMFADGELENTQGLPDDHIGNTKEYVDVMNLMLDLGVRSLNLDLRNLKAYPPTSKIWYQIQNFPAEIVPIFDAVIKDVMTELAEDRVRQRRAPTAASRQRDGSSVPPVPSSDMGGPSNPHENGEPLEDLDDIVMDVEKSIYKVRPFGLDKTINLRDLNPGDMEKLVSLQGLVIRSTPIIPDMKEAFFRCSVCHHTVKVEIDQGKISEPTVCPRQQCASPNTMQIVHNRSGFADKQVIKLQETPDSVPDGQTPHSVSLCVYDDLVDVCKAGDRVEITGVFKATQVRINPRQRTVKNIFKTYVDTIHVQKVDKRRVGIDVTTIEEELSEQAAGGVEETRRISEEEEAKIKATAVRPDIYDLLSRSLAPSINEMDDVKKGILLQLFGGTNKSFSKGGSPRYRGDINILLCGDPSTAKSQILQYVHKIAPRGVYTSGKGSSAVGLTAYITRDPDTRQLVLESGALVLSDGGICCIDEFDKMSDSTRSVLHEVMEQQTVSIAKAGIITTLNARTSILASANPIGSKYNLQLSVPQNIDLPPTLLSRFDLVYLVLDRIDESADRRLARHLVDMYIEDTPDSGATEEILPIEFLTSYISYARTSIQPTITQATADVLVTSYVAMRALGADVSASEKRITATTRQLESMIRLSEAHAKMRLSMLVEEADVLEAVRLIHSALKQAATDARTGLIDMSLLTEGTSASERRRKDDLKAGVLGLLDENTRGAGAAVPAGQVVRYADLLRGMQERSSVVVETGEVVEALRVLETEGKVQVSGEGPRKVVRRVAGIV